MSKATTESREYTTELMSQVAGRYLLLIRENYLSEPDHGQSLREYMVGSLRQLLHSGRFSCVQALAESSDWREAVVGLHYAIILASPAFDLTRPGRTSKVHDRLAQQIGDKFELELRNRVAHSQALSARPAFLLLALLNRHSFFVDFLAADQPSSLDEDIYAAALESEQLTRQRENEESASSFSELESRLITRLQAERPRDDLPFLASKRRFLQSWRYWTAST